MAKDKHCTVYTCSINAEEALTSDAGKDYHNSAKLI